MEKIIAFCKRKGFIFPSSDIYGGFANTYTYGPYGSQLKKNLKDLWWKTFVENKENIVGIDGNILLNPKTWEASGHTAGFSDSMTDCKDCKKRIRADHLIEENLEMDCEGFSPEKLSEIISKNSLKCSFCGSLNLTEVRNFNLMFETEISKTGESQKTYLRPETAQAIFLEFKNVLDSTRQQIPFGIAQIGKAFRNEITPGNFTFRLIEFEQMEIEYFIEEKNWEKDFEFWKKEMLDFCFEIGLKKENFKFKEHAKEKLSHYSKRTADIEFNFPFGGFKELFGLAYRTDFDLSKHQEFSKKDLRYRNPQTNDKFIPHVLEPTFGLDRAILAVLCENYKENYKDSGRNVLQIPSKLSPVKIGVFPLVKKFSEFTKKIFKDLQKDFICEFDESGSIGKRYARQDEIGTPFCLTVDFDTIGEGDEIKKEWKNTVSVRNRDSGEQDRIKIEDLKDWFFKNL